MKDSVYELIVGELEYQAKWDEMPEEERPEKDADKTIEHWLAYMGIYLDRARQAFGEGDELEAMANVRKVTALGVRAMQLNETPPR